jgi:hypothetical protein
MQAGNNSGSRFNPNGTVTHSYLSSGGGSTGGGSVSPAIGGSLPPEMMSQNANGLASPFNPMTAQ